jgi:hypothetical protein
MLYSIGFTEKGHSPEPQVGYKKEIFREEIRGRQKISKIIPGYEIEFGPTVRAGKEAVRLSQSDRSAALRTRMFDFPGDGFIFFHHTDCSK